MRLSPRIESIAPSATLAMTAKAKALKARGVDVIALSAGEPDFDTPEHVKAAAHAAIDRGETKYTPVSGTPALRGAVAAWAARFYSRPVTAAQVSVGAGGKQVLFNACAALLAPGDEALIGAPYWVSYPDMVRFAEGVPVIVPTGGKQGFLPDARALEKAITRKTRLLILNSPSNPTGATYDRKALEGIAELLRAHPNVFVITDDIYCALVYDAPFVSLAQIAPDLAERTLIVAGVSKTYAMTGWRIGYGIGPEPLISAMDRLQGASTSGASSIAQAAALAAVTGPQEVVDGYVQIFKKRRDRMVAALRAIPEVEVATPGGAFYVFPNIGAYLGGAVRSSGALCERLLEQAHVALVPGDAFGADDHVRLSFACSDQEIDEGVRRMREGLLALR